jgi:predicted  nucleic acid-binding Zn-ribbon protein
MSQYEELKKKHQEIYRKKVFLENEITKVQANRDMKLQELKDEFGITPEEIADAKSQLEQEMAELEESIAANLVKVEEYVNTISERIANVNAESTGSK